jgi:hypothetical protein
VEELVAIMISRGGVPVRRSIISVIGMARKDENTFARIGIGSIFYHFEDKNSHLVSQALSGKRNKRQTLWQMRLIRMC